jgi:hypothetical protein
MNIDSIAKRLKERPAGADLLPQRYRNRLGE